MSTGLANEPLGVEKYVEVLDDVNIYFVGIVISPWGYWIDVSPDRKVYNPSRQPPVGILEIKCPCATSVLEASCLNVEPE